MEVVVKVVTAVAEAAAAVAFTAAQRCDNESSILYILL